jgi:hypothetical protein
VRVDIRRDQLGDADPPIDILNQIERMVVEEQQCSHAAGELR